MIKTIFSIKNNTLFRRHAMRTTTLFRILFCCAILIPASIVIAQNAKKPVSQKSDTMKLGSVMLPSAFLDQVVRVAKSDGGALIFADAKGKLVIAERTGDRFKSDFWTQDAFVLAARWVVDHGEPLVIEGGINEVPEGLKPIPDYLQSYLGYPLKQGSKVFGVVNLVRMYGKDNFSESDMDVVELIVAQSADAVERLKEQSIKDLVQNREISANTKVYFASDQSVIREKSISLELGLNFLLASPPIFVSDTINNQGMNIGFMVPIRVPRALLWYRVQTLFHGTRSYRGNQMYLTAVNEFLGGKSLRIKSIPFEYTPLLGIGFNNGIILQNMFKAGFMGAGVHYYWHFDIGFIIREQYRIKDVNLTQGLLVNFARAFVYDDNSKMRLNVSLILSY
jgi:hypothetical protein